MSGDAQLMLMIAGMHLLGLVCVAVLIIPALREEPGLPPRNDTGSDDGGGWGPKAPPKPKGPSTRAPSGGVKKVPGVVEGVGSHAPRRVIAEGKRQASPDRVLINGAYVRVRRPPLFTTPMGEPERPSGG